MAETTQTKKIHKTEAEWRELLTPEQFHVMREGWYREGVYWSSGEQPRGWDLSLREL